MSGREEGAMKILIIIMLIFVSCASIKECAVEVGKKPIIDRVKFFEHENELRVISIDSSIVNRTGVIFIKYKYIK